MVVEIVALGVFLYVAYRRRMWSRSSTGTRSAFVVYVALAVILIAAAELIAPHLSTSEDFIATYSMLCTLLLVSVQGFLLAAVAQEQDHVRAVAWVASLVMVAGFGAWVAASMPDASSHSKGMVFAGFVFGAMITIMADAMNGAPATRGPERNR